MIIQVQWYICIIAYEKPFWVQYVSLDMIHNMLFYIFIKIINFTIIGDSFSFIYYR